MIANETTLLNTPNDIEMNNYSLQITAFNNEGKIHTTYGISNNINVSMSNVSSLTA